MRIFSFVLVEKHAHRVLFKSASIFLLSLLGSFRGLFVAGEHMDKDTMRWTRKAISAPVYDNWWQTGEELQLICP